MYRSVENKNFFSKTLLVWNRTENVRKMPWKGEEDPYKIWISEIILQQTRVQQGLAYYERFIKTFPDVQTLATAKDQSVFKLWEGLGYYTRCKNLIASAKYIHEKLNNQFPEKYEDILALKGIGNYTASAIASFAFNKPYAVLDGNVFRVLSRFFGIEIPINTTTGKKYYAELAQMLLDKKNPAEYNQAIMDFGAVICKPALPLCYECPLQKKCVAFLNNKVSVLPINEKIIKQKKRFFNYLIVEYKDKIYVRERTEKDIWQNLFEFILIETNSLADAKDFLKDERFLSAFETSHFVVNRISKTYTQKLTHQLVSARFFHIKIDQKMTCLKNFQLVSKKQLNKFPFPKIITSYLGEEKA